MKWFNDVMNRLDAARPEFHDFRQGFAWDMTVAMIVIVFGVFLAMVSGLDNGDGPSITGLLFFGTTLGAGFLVILRAVLRAKNDSE